MVYITPTKVNFETVPICREACDMSGLINQRRPQHKSNWVLSKGQCRIYDHQSMYHTLSNWSRLCATSLKIDKCAYEFFIANFQSDTTVLSPGLGTGACQSTTRGEKQKQVQSSKQDIGRSFAVLIAMFVEKERSIRIHRNKGLPVTTTCSGKITQGKNQISER